MNSNVEMSLVTRRSTPGPDVGRRALDSAVYSRPPVDKRTPRGAHAMLRKISNSWNLFWWGKGTYPDRDNKIEDVFLRFYTGSTFGEYEDIRLAQATKLLQHPSFNRSQPTVLYAHGFQETALQESVEVMVTAYLEARPNTNVILLDWSNMAFGSYFINAAPNTKKVGNAAAQYVSELVAGGLDVEKLHVIGHSLGGQLIGFLARRLTSSYNVTLPRITALDPAFPEFYPGLLLAHISATDARVVDVVHTDAGGYGAPVRGGTADFWPNGGKAKQPGCPKFTPIPLSDEDLCSHWRSWRFYAESVRTPRAFAAAPADSYFQFKNDARPEKVNSVVYMGADMDPTATGNYYLTTNAASPFGKGLDGIYYQKDKKK